MKNRYAIQTEDGRLLGLEDSSTDFGTVWTLEYSNNVWFDDDLAFVQDVAKGLGVGSKYCPKVADSIKGLGLRVVVLNFVVENT